MLYGVVLATVLRLPYNTSQVSHIYTHTHTYIIMTDPQTICTRHQIKEVPFAPKIEEL